MKKQKSRLALFLLAAMLVNTIAAVLPAGKARAYSDMSGNAYSQISHAGEIYTTGGNNTAGMSCINVYVNGSLYGSQCFAEYDFQTGGWSEVRKVADVAEGITDIFTLSSNAVRIDFSKISPGYDLSQAAVEKIICQYDVTSPRTKPPYGIGTTTYYYSFMDNALEEAVKSRGIFTGGKYQVFSMSSEDAPDYGSPMVNGVLNIYITGVTAKTMTVRFDTRCGQSFPDKTVTFQSTYGSLPVPERAGYKFTGWYKDAAYKFTVTENTYITEFSQEPFTLYAGWKAKSYSVHFDCAGGTVLPDAEVVFGTAFGKLPVPERKGYTFKGWKNSDGVLVDADTVLQTAGDVTLTAVWEKAKETNGDKTGKTDGKKNQKPESGEETVAEKKQLSKVVLKKYKKGTKVVKGTAKAKSQVVLKVGKKTYTVKASKKGTFTVKLKKKLKKGQKITVYAKLAGYKNSKKVSRKVK